MSKKIFEEGPSEGGSGLDRIRKAARQLAYDTKYKVKKSMGEKASRMSPAAVTKAYLSQLAKSPAPGPVKTLAQKILIGKGVKEEYDLDDLASTTVANVMYKVFVEGIPTEEAPLGEEYINQLMEEEGKKYKIVVTDKKTGNQYRRLATREKIAELRANPNISRVEITNYGEAIKGEKEKGEQTSSVKSGKGLDPVGKEDSKGDVDNDGIPASRDKNDQYLLNRRKKVGQAIATRKEGFDFFEQKRPTKDQNEVEIVSNEEKGVDNRKLIKVFPELGVKESALQKFDRLISEKMNLAKADMGDVVKDFQKSDAPQFAGKSKKKRQQMAVAAKLEAERKSMKEAAEKKEDECGDVREIPTKVNNVKNKLRSMGLKMDYEPNGEIISEREMDEPGERDERPDVKAHNRAVRYRPRPRRPRMEDDPRYGTPRDKGGNWKY